MQREYIHVSRISEERQRRQIIVVLSLGLLVLAFLSVFAWGQRNEAKVQQGIAQVASTRAIDQESIAKTNEAETKRQAQIAFARQLAAQSVSLRDKNFPLSMLLSIESFQTFDTFQSRKVLLSSAIDRPQLQAYLIGHTTSLSNVVFSPDGRILASGNSDGTIILWDTTTHQPIGHPLTGYTRYVLRIVFSPDGKILALGNGDGTVVLWDIAANRPIGQPLTGYTSPISSIAFSPDGNILAASGNDNKAILFWDVATQQPIGQPLTGHTDTVQEIAFNPDGKTLASRSSDDVVIFWDLETHQPIGQPLTEYTVTNIAFSPDGEP